VVARYPITAGYPLLYLVAQATSAEGTHTYAVATRAHATTTSYPTSIKCSIHFIVSQVGQKYKRKNFNMISLLFLLLVISKVANSSLDGQWLDSNYPNCGRVILTTKAITIILGNIFVVDKNNISM
jgi:hypothetical protein